MSSERPQSASNAGKDTADVQALVQDLNSVVEKNAETVTPENLSSLQTLVNKMAVAVGPEKSLGPTNNTGPTNAPPHPELESELQHEFAEIQPKVEQGTVTKEEANHLHSLEARAHGHTEKGGLTAHAQSVAAKRERKSSLSDASNSQATSNNQGISPEERSHRDKEANLRKVEFALRPKIENEPEHVSKEDASLLVSRERRAHGIIEQGSLASEAQSLADKNANRQDTGDVADEHPKPAAEGNSAVLQEEPGMATAA
jgi:hypothetical protein